MVCPSPSAALVLGCPVLYSVSKETENQLTQNSPTISYLKSYDDVDVCSTFHSIDTQHIRRAIQIAFIVIFRWRLRTIVVGVSPNLVARITLVVTYAQLAYLSKFAAGFVGVGVTPWGGVFFEKR